jgi:cell division protein FtsQ
VSRAGSTTRDRARSRRGSTPDRGTAVTPLRSRRRTRRPAHPRRRLLAVLAAVLGLAGLAAWTVLASSLLAVDTVQVDGTDLLSEEAVVRAAGVPAGTPLARVDTTGAAARVAALPQVAAVEVTRGWPGTIVVTVTERVAVAVVERDGTRHLIDADGVLFDTITGDPPAGVVPLAVTDPGPDDAATAAALAALTSLPAEVAEEVAGAAALSADDVRLSFTDGRLVVWGSAEQTDRKARVLAALLEQIDAGTLEPAQTLDVSTPDAVVLR